jgi:hypothetical protein
MRRFAATVRVATRVTAPTPDPRIASLPLGITGTYAARVARDIRLPDARAALAAGRDRRDARRRHRDDVERAQACDPASSGTPCRMRAACPRRARGRERLTDSAQRRRAAMHKHRATRRIGRLPGFQVAHYHAAPRRRSRGEVDQDRATKWITVRAPLKYQGRS